MKKIIAVVLAVIIGMTASANAFAASAKKTYISDLVAVTAKDESDAKAQLEKAGYKLLAGSNVNSSLKTGVYLGYKETDNADEAITDISGMNMTGKFSYSDYKTIMKQNEERIKETIDGFEPVIAEYQANYEAGKPTALAAYEALNTYKDDDSGKLIGDYLLEYDFSDASNKKMTETFMQANAQIILAIMQQASFAGDDNEDTMIDRLSKLGPNGISKKYNGLYPSVAKANQAMEAEYGDVANEILNDWNSVYQYILDAEKSVDVDEDGMVTFTDDILEPEEKTEEDYKDIENEEAKECLEAVDAAADVADVTKNEIDYSFYNLLIMTEYGDGTLLDFFKRSKDEVRKEELYPLVDSMSEGQRSQIKMNGLLLTLESALSDIEEESEEAGETVEKVQNITDTFGEISIYQGVDRSIFEDGVAFTSTATEHETLTGESWFSKLGIESEKNAWLAAMLVSSFVTVALVGSCITASLVQKAQIKAEQIAVEEANIPYKNAKAIYEEADKRYNAFSAFFDRKVETFDVFEFNDLTASEKANMFQVISNDMQNKREAFEELHEAVADPNVGRTAGIIKCVSFVFLVVMIAVDAYTLYEFLTTPAAVEEAIPHHIMTAAATEFGEEYVYYATVKNLKGEVQDTNNHEADAKIGWLTLYTTKDKAAGNPILAENLRAQTGSTDFKEETAFIHLFNETAALNLTDEVYTGAADKANGTYILFSRDASALVGSAITNGTAALIGAGGLAVGTILGALLAKLAGKKKKETAVA